MNDISTGVFKGLTNGSINKKIQTINTWWLVKYSLNELLALKLTPVLAQYVYQ